MKNLLTSIMTALLLLTFIPSQQAANVINPSTMTTTAPKPSPEAQVLLSRLDAIKSMDKSNLTWKEKQQLRKETRSIKGHLKALSGGVYLSAGAVILLVILLIVLL